MRKSYAHLVIALVLVLTAACSGRDAQTQADQPPAEAAPVAPAPEPEMPAAPAPSAWNGVVALPGMQLDFSVTFTAGDAGASATIDIPLQGVDDLPLADVRYSDTELAFTLAPPGAPEAQHAVFTCTRDGDNAKGTLAQSGMTFEVTMEVGDAAGPNRPQTPQPPFSYTSRDVSYEIPADGTVLTGTLTVPEGAGPHPAVLLITGSGSQDRDESIMGHKPFLVLADHLSRRDVAVLRVDDRGVGGSTGARPDLTTHDFVGDVLAGVKFLGQQPEIDAKRIGLVGHSEGGVIAPMAAVASKDVAFIVLLAGTGVPGGELLAQQNRALFQAQGATQEQTDVIVAALGAVFAAILDESADRQTRVDALRRLMQAQMTAAGVAKDVSEEELEAALAGLESPWMRTFITLDPAEALANVTCPVLALGGTLDLQVPAKENLPAIAAALKKAGNADVTTESLEGLNHLFQTAKTGNVDEYAQLEETFAPAALEKVSSWIRSRTGLAP